jgi:hypothetical protein
MDHGDKNLKLVDEKYKKLIRVPNDQEYPILEFTNLKIFSEVIPGKVYHPSLGCGFYEFTKPEYISRNKQVILMDKVLAIHNNKGVYNAMSFSVIYNYLCQYYQNEQLYYGPGARYEIQGIGLGQEYDETSEVEPNFDKNKWKCAFIQTRSNIRKLQPNTWFLYCKLHDIVSIRFIPNSFNTLR